MNPIYVVPFGIAIFTLFMIASVLGYKYILELRSAREQRKNEMVQRAVQLRWDQARLGKEINDEFQDDDTAGVAVLLMDFSGPDWGRKFRSRLGEEFEATEMDIDITLRKIIEAEEQPVRLTAKEIAIAECFDSLFYYFAQFEHYLEIGLVQFEDLEFPARYYVDRMSRTLDRRNLFTQYFNTFGLHEAERFVNRFRSWRINRAGQERVRVVATASTA